MENIQDRAKNQLLSIQDSDDGFYYEPLNIVVPVLKQKSKSKLSARILPSHSAHKDTQIFDNLNNKELLKNKLKKLLEKQKESPKSQIKRINTVGSLESEGKNQRGHKFKNNYEQSRLLGLENRTILSIKKQNISTSQKTLIPLESRSKNSISIFEQENQQIRKFIKKRIEEKANSKKSMIAANTLQNIVKTKKIADSQNRPKQNNEQNTLMKLRCKNKQNEMKNTIDAFLQSNITRTKSKNKQNFNSFSTVSSTPLSFNCQKESSYQNRKLRDILF